MKLDYFEVSKAHYCEYRDKILDLRKNVFPEEDFLKMESIFWDWQFKENVYQDSQIFVVNDLDTNQIIAHYALVPYQMLLDGKLHLIGLAVDAMVHTNYRKMGICSKLQMYAIEHSRYYGTIGYTLRDEIKSIEKKGGYRCVKYIPVYIYPVNFRKIFKVFRNGTFEFLAPLAKIIYKAIFSNKVKSSIPFDIVDHIPHLILEKYNIWLQQIFKAYCPRDEKILKWRLSNEAGVDYSIYKYSAQSNIYFVTTVKEIQGLNALNIVDIIFDKYSENDIATGLGRLIHKADKEQYDCISFFCADNGSISKILRKSGLLKSPYLFQFIVHNSNSQLTYDLSHLNLFLTYFDTDLL